VSNESRATKWLRRFLAYIGAIMRHLYVLIGSAALTIITSGPSWVASELPRVWQERIEAWWLFPPLTHWLTWSIPAAGIFIASFLAWNEDRDLLESKNVALAKLQDDRPRFGTSEIRRVSFQADQERGPDWLKIFIFVTLRNLGGKLGRRLGSSSQRAETRRFDERDRPESISERRLYKLPRGR